MIIILSIFQKFRRLFGDKSDPISETPDLVEIGGTFKGDLINGRQVLVSSTGLLEGDVIATCLELYGTATGNIQVDNLLIGSSGKLYCYSLSYNNLEVEEGGVIGQATGGKREEAGGGKKKDPN